MNKKFLIIGVCMLLAACSSDRKEESRASSQETAEPKQVSSSSSEQTEPTPEIDGKNIDGSTIDFYFTPSVDENVVRKNGKELLNFLEKETGLKYELHIPSSYNEMISDFGNGKADVAIMNSLGYVKAHEAYGASAKLRAVRYGKSTYFGQIIANVASSITEIKHLHGKKIAYTDSSSTSGYLFPQMILRESGIVPSGVVFAGKHDDVVRAVYTGQVDAGATFYSEPSKTGEIRDARARVINEFPDVTEKVKVIEITEPIPNDPVVFSASVPNDISFKISLGLIKFMSSQSGKDAMMAVYSTEGFVRCSDSDYDVLRVAMRE